MLHRFNAGWRCCWRSRELATNNINTLVLLDSTSRYEHHPLTLVDVVWRERKAMPRVGRDERKSQLFGNEARVCGNDTLNEFPLSSRRSSTSTQRNKYRQKEIEVGGTSRPFPTLRTEVARQLGFERFLQLDQNTSQVRGTYLAILPIHRANVRSYSDPRADASRRNY